MHARLVLAHALGEQGDDLLARALRAPAIVARNLDRRRTVRQRRADAVEHDRPRVVVRIGSRGRAFPFRRRGFRRHGLRTGIASLAAPPLAEGLLRRLGEVAGRRPARQRPGQPIDPPVARQGTRAEPSRLLRRSRRRGARRTRGTSRASRASPASNPARRPPPSRAGARAPSGCRSRPGRPRNRRRRGSRRTAGSDPARARAAAASGSPRSGPGRPTRRRGRRCASRPGRRSGTPSNGCSAAPGGRPRRRARRSGRCRAAPGGTRVARRRDARRSRRTCTGFIRSPVDERGSSCRNTSMSCHDGTSFSTPITVTSTSGSVVHMRPLPSDSTTQTVPVSATAKFAPEMPMRASRNFARRCRRAASASASGSSVRSGRSSSRANSSRISARFLWIAGTRMCDWTSSPSWMINSARSVSIGRTPEPSSASFSLISSVAIDFTFTTSSTPCARAISHTIRFASAASRAQCTWPPAAPTAASSRSSCVPRSPSVWSLTAWPAAFNSAQSGSSSTTAARLARIVVVALARLRRSCESRSVTLAAFGKLTRRAPPPGARRARPCAGARGRRRSASGRSCPPRRPPRRPCRARLAPCPPPSPRRPRRS